MWYQVTVPASGQVTVTTSSPLFSPFTNSGLAFYTAATCTGPFTLVSCDDNSGPGNMSALTYTGAAGTVLWVRVWENGNNSFGAFNICATAPIPPPSNNEACTAAAVTVAGSCTYTTYSNAGATNSATLPGPGCGNFGAGSLDVWFSFVAPPTGIAVIQSQAGSLTDGAMALYYDAPPLDCAGPFALVECDDDDGPGTMPYLSFTNLVPGGTYYLRFWGFGAASGTFGLCVHAPGSVPAGDCVYVLELFDTFGDGWGSSNVSISINGGPFTPYSITGSYGVWLIGLNIGQILVVQYTATGPNQAQNRYELGYFPGGNIIFSAGPSPAAGISFTQTIDCQPPPASDEDCIGAVTICGNSAFNNNTNNTGSFNDLNAANFGCLLNAERQGTWYNFSPSIGGNIAFTIAPTNATDDYDFAIWGPFPPGSTPGSMCPPPGAPARCSYSALTGNTGLNYTATDNSEGAGGDKWVNDLTVTAGQVYLMYISNWSQSGLAFNLNWNLTNGASLDCTVLPIELLEFEGGTVPEGIRLDWSTASELENDGFVVERSVDAVTFTEIGWVPGVGNSTQHTAYSFVDPQPVTGVNHYRLRQVDRNGGEELSHAIAVLQMKGTEEMVVYPNPGEDGLNVALGNGASGGTILLMDAAGREVARTGVLDGRASIDARTLPGGLYVVRALSAEGAVISGTTWVKR